MSENFEKLKRRYLINAVIISAVCGVSAGVISAFTVLLALKLSAITINAGFYVLIAFGSAALTGGVLFLILRPTDKKVAKKLDNEYSLNERVQTMVECANSDGEIIRLQREDADERLSKLPQKSRFYELVKFIAVPVVAVAMLFTGIFVPRVPSAAEKPEEPIDISVLQQMQVRELIEDVKNSDLQATLSEAVVAVLEEFADALEDINYQSVLKTSVISTVTVVDALFASANSYMAIYGELIKYENTKDLGESVLKSVTSYKNPDDKSKITKLSKVDSLSESSDEKISALLSAGIKAEHEKLTGVYDETTEKREGLRDTALIAEVNTYISSVSTALGATDFNTNDALYSAMYGLYSELEQIPAYVNGGGWSPSSLWEEIDKIVDRYVSNGTVALSVQTYNCMMDEFVRARLAEIFGISYSELPSQEAVVPDVSEDNNDGDEKDPDTSHSGGTGPGESNYGSNDIIFDPENEVHTAYGEVFQSYYAEMEERVNKGDIPDELIKVLNEYFKTLNIARNKDKN